MGISCKTLWNILSRGKDDDLEAELNQWGEGGWEVIGFRLIENTNRSQVIAKRLLTQDVRRQWSMP